MLYHAWDLQQAFLQPVLAGASLVEGMTRSWPNARALGGVLDTLDTALRHRPKPAWGITTSSGETVHQTTVRQTPFMDLVAFARDGADRPPILLVAPLSGHHATLLRDTARALLEAGHPVFVTDWLCASRVPVVAGPFGLDAYIDHVMLAMCHVSADGHPVHAMAVCQPAPAVLAAAALMAEDGDPATPESLVLMGGPVDPAAAPTAVTRFAHQHPEWWFRSTLIHTVPVWRTGGLRRVYPGFIQLAAFMSMKPDHHYSAYGRSFRAYLAGEADGRAQVKEFYDEYMAVLDMHADFYLETLDRVFRRRLLPRGAFVWRGRTVRPEALTKTRVMAIEGGRDDISAPGQTAAALALVPGAPRREHLLEKDAGHYGLFSGRRWRNAVRPAVTAFVG